MIDKVMFDAMDKQKDCKDGFDRVFDMIDKIEYLSEKSRTEGLLALEDVAEDMCKMDRLGYFNGYKYMYADLSGTERFLACAIMDVVDGIDPETLEQLMCSRYLANNYQGRDALIAFAVIKGMLDIQVGENPKFILHELLNLMPVEAGREYCIKRDKKKADE